MNKYKNAPADVGASVAGAHINSRLQNSTFLKSRQITKECRQESYIQRPTRHKKILETLGGKEMTAREIAEAMGYRDLNAVKPRLTELLQAGAVEVTEYQRRINMDNYFDALSRINVNNKTEKKGDLTYLSWAFAWAEVKKLFPSAFYTIYENDLGWNYHTDNNTCWVKTGVTINEIEHIEYLPVMDYKNRSIPHGNVTSFDINKAIQRSLTKACARHGLGLYIYAGEDLPDSGDSNKSLTEPEPKEAPGEDMEFKPEPLSDTQIKYVWSKCKALGLVKKGDLKKICGAYTPHEMTTEHLAKFVAYVNKEEDAKRAAQKEFKEEPIDLGL